MRTRGRARTLLIMAVAAAALHAATGLGQSYGDHDQVLTIGAGAFRDQSLYPGDVNVSDGYMYGLASYMAPLLLPEGADVRQLCLYANDNTPHGFASAYLVAVKLVPGGGGDPIVVTIPSSMVSSTSDIGYGYYCTENLSYTIRSVTDVDGDGIPDAVVYYAIATMYDFNNISEIGVGGIRVTWRRQVSPPPTSPTFSDVPTNDVGFAFIEALAASGITAGCGGGNYCPAAPLTRRQMAVYMAKALGLHWGE